ncbi:MAG: ATP-binding protein, partial [Eubacteriales bacterium]|nr:ATP-binding protein [Eubacteriales bacterium]
MAYAPIKGQPWVLGIEINENDYIGQSNFKTLNLIYFLVVLLVLLILITLFLYYQYSKPFSNLINHAKKIEQGDFSINQPICNYAEMEELSKALNSMSTKINNFTSSLIKKNNEIKSIFDSIMGLLMIISPNYEIIMINNQGLKQFLNNTPLPTGKKCYELIGHSSTVCKGCKIKDAFLQKKPTYSQVVLDNDIYNNSYSPIINNNKVDGVVVYSQNITEKVMMEKEILQSEKMAGIGLLSSAIAHELKNPLAIIKGAAYFIREQTRCKEDMVLKENVVVIDQAIGVAEKTVCNFLDFASTKRDNYMKINVTKLIDQILLLSRSEFIRRNIEIKVDFQPSQLYYYGEAELLKNIFFNLLSNSAIAIGLNGQITIMGRYIEEGCNQLEVSIKDNGAGIDEDILDKVFKPFFTTDSTGTGTGLGLWITKKMVERLSGKIILKSQKGIGTEFIIVLPTSSKGGSIDEA